MCNLIIFWRSVPIDVGKGDFEFFAKFWAGNIYVVSHKDYPEERKACGYENDFYENVKYIALDNFADPEGVAKSIIEENYNAIHVFNGIRENNSLLLKYLINVCKKKKIEPLVAVMAERPNLFGSPLKKIIKKTLYKIIYGTLAKRYDKYIGCFLAMGQYGVRCYKEYGFSEEKLYPYMYCPKLDNVETINHVADKVRFLYIGRFDFSAKGVDVLMKAFSGLPESDKWALDMVGGYGENKDEIVEWCNGVNVRFLGHWDSRDICIKMQDYDVCLVPSKYDGWNLIPNQAINCGIATIISDEAVSDELIKYSGAGYVFKSNDEKALKSILEKVVQEKNIINEWKMATKKYKDKISGKTVGKYLYDIIQYTFNNSQTKPSCPWVNKER